MERETLVQGRNFVSALYKFFGFAAKLVKITLLQPASACTSTFYCETIKKPGSKNGSLFLLFTDSLHLH